jgi:hypothetical protein
MNKLYRDLILVHAEAAVSGARAAVGWLHWPSNPKLQEVIAFVATIMNGYKKIRLSRGSPRLGNYLLD